MPWSYNSRMTRLKPARLQLEVTIAKSWSMIQCMYTLWQRVEPPPDKIPCQPIKLSAESPRVEPAHTCQGNFVAQSWCQNRACACCKHGSDVLRLITFYTSHLPRKLCGTGLRLQKWFLGLKTLLIILTTSINQFCSSIAVTGYLEAIAHN